MLRLTQKKRTEYHEQVDRLIKELRKHVENREELKVTKVVKAGSFAKYTILRKTNDDAVDVDVVFYITGKDASQETFTQLSDTIYELLIKIYPNKKVDDFEIQRRAATVTFIGRRHSPLNPGSRASGLRVAVRHPGRLQERNLRTLLNQVCRRSEEHRYALQNLGPYG